MSRPRTMITISLEFEKFLEKGFYTIHDYLQNRAYSKMSQRLATADENEQSVL
ncbi:MAG TPA: hypothetical protein VFV92_12945 [Candidatus Bathyarchaeia archaeon]|nr:hypothetical protein [Candidatus Bathyarchaeia archaeon]